MPGVQILFHSSGERVGGPNLPQRGFFVPAVRGAAVRCGNFSAGEGRSGRCRLRAEKEGRSGALRCVAGTFRRGKGGVEGAGCGRKKRGGAGRCGGNKGGKAEGRAGVPACGGESSRRAGKGWKMGDGSGGWKQKNPEGACCSPEFFMIRNLRINRAAPVVLPPFCRRPGRRTAVLAASALGRPAASASAAFLPPPAICSGAR